MSEVKLLPRKRKPLQNHLFDRLSLLSKSRFPQHPYLAVKDFLYICAKHPPNEVKDLSNLYSKYFLNEDEEDEEDGNQNNDNVKNENS